MADLASQAVLRPLQIGDAGSCALYAKAGFVCNASKPVRSFGVDLIEHEWSRDLGADPLAIV